MSRKVNIFNVLPECDPDALAFLAATGISDATIESAICTLVTSLKSAGLWTKMNAIYPFVGGTATTHKFNLKNPADTNAAFRLQFFGGWTHSSNGALPNGTNAYADTFLNGSVLNLTSTHLSFYSRTQINSGTQVELGSFTNASFPLFRFTQLRAASNAVLGSNSSALFYTTTADARGFWLASKRANNDREAYRNGISEATITTNDTAAFPNLNQFIGARNDNGVVKLFSNKQCAFASIGEGLNDTEALNYYNAVQAFQVTLGRNV